MFAIVINSMLQKFKLPAEGFVDDIKLVVDVNIYSCETIQEEINKVADWSDDHLMPLSIEKGAMLYAGRN